MLRVTGECVAVDRRSGTSRAGNAYTMRTASVLVGRRAVVTVNLGDDTADLREGEPVDLAVNYRGEFRGVPQFQTVGSGDWYSVVGEPHPQKASA